MVKQKGFTLLELMVSLALIAIFGSFGYSTYKVQMFEGKIEQMELEVKILIREAELARSSEAATSIIGGIYVRTYKTLALGSTVADLAALNSRQIAVDNNNPFGFPYSIEITDDISYVRSTLPGSVEYKFAPTSTVAGNTVLEFSSVLTSAVNSFPSATAVIQKSLFLEGTRH